MLTFEEVLKRIEKDVNFPEGTSFWLNEFETMTEEDYQELVTHLKCVKKQADVVNKE